MQCGTIRAIDALLGLISAGLNRKAWPPGGSIKRGLTQANALRNCRQEEGENELTQPGVGNSRSHLSPISSVRVLS